MSMADDFICLVSDHLRQLVDTQQQWVDTVGGVFEQKQQDNPGWIWGLPKESIYTGIEDDARRSIQRSWYPRRRRLLSRQVRRGRPGRRQ
jgi:hypothetical protein